MTDGNREQGTPTKWGPAAGNRDTATAAGEGGGDTPQLTSDLRTLTSGSHPSALTPHSDGGGLFWVLIALAAAVFAPCVLLPVWREYQALKYAEQIEQATLDQARDDLFAEQRRLAGLQNDPSVIARLVRRDLHYAAPGERMVPVAIREELPDETAPPLTPVEPPPAIARLVEKLPEADYDRLFCHSQTRTILMCLSGGLVLAALALFPTRR